MEDEPYAGLKDPRTRATDPVLLKCGHLVIFDPMPRSGDILYCYRCADYSRIQFAVKVVKEIRIIQCRDCYYRRRLKEWISEAHLLAETHALKTAHTLDIMDATKIIETVTIS
jgi:hypothetical protein